MAFVKLMLNANLLFGLVITVFSIVIVGRLARKKSDIQYFILVIVVTDDKMS